jgi:FkbM family methyltransferase
MLAAGHAETNRLVSRTGRESCHDATTPVRTQTLDGVARLCSTGALDLIKTDTEGHDLEVLSGGKHSLARCKVVICEVGLTKGDTVHTPLKHVDKHPFGCWIYAAWPL